jgi:hypothetical protein
MPKTPEEMNKEYPVGDSFRTHNIHILPQLSSPFHVLRPQTLSSGTKIELPGIPNYVTNLDGIAPEKIDEAIRRLFEEDKNTDPK